MRGQQGLVAIAVLLWVCSTVALHAQTRGYVPHALGPSLRDQANIALGKNDYAGATLLLESWLKADLRDSASWYNLAVAVVPTQLTVIDYLPAPDTLEERSAKAVLVVRGTVAGISAPYLSHEHVVRAVTVQVTETFRAARGRTVAFQVRIEQPGGNIKSDKSDRITDYPYEPLQEGETVVLFLADSLTPGLYDVSFGPAGLFRIDGQRGTVALSSRGASLRDFKERQQVGLVDFLTALRTATAAAAKRLGE